MTGISLNVNRQKLIDQLTAKRTEIVEDYAKQREHLQGLLDALKTDAGGWADYHKAVAAGLEDGSLRYTDSGKIQATQRDGLVPVKPNSTARSHRRGMAMTRADIEHNLELLEDGGYYFRQDVAPIDAALRILELSDDEVIQIAGSDYDRVLSTGGRNWHWEV